VKRLLLVAFAVAAAFGIAQHLTNSALLSVQSNDGTFLVHSYGFFGNIRAFSLFDSALTFGSFCVVVAALALGLVVEGRYVLGATLYSVAAYCCYITLTRAVYLQLLCATVSALLRGFVLRKRRGGWLLVAYLLLCLAATVRGAMEASASQVMQDLQSNDSILERLFEWQYYASQFLSGSFAQQLFGSGTFQNDQIAPGALYIDNMVLGLLVSVGVVGAALALALTWFFWKALADRSLRSRSALSVALASVWDTFVIIGFFNLSIASLYALFILGQLTAAGREGAPEGIHTPAI
jgi:O-antigen ligase